MDMVKWARRRTRTMTLVDQDNLNDRLFWPIQATRGQIAPARLFEPLEMIHVDVPVRPIRYVSHGTRCWRRAGR